jgi:hypothetical protein
MGPGYAPVEEDRSHARCGGVSGAAGADHPYLADDRKQASLDGFWPTLTPAQREGITAVAMDMWEPYVQATRAMAGRSLVP